MFILSLKIILTLSIVKAEPLHSSPVNSELTKPNLPSIDDPDDLKSAKIEYLKYVNQYLNENNLSRNVLHGKSTDDATISNELMKLTKSLMQTPIGRSNDSNRINSSTNSTDRQTNNSTNSTDDPIDEHNHHNKQASFIDRIITRLWSLKELAEIRLRDLEDNEYVKNFYQKANQLRREDVCIPFVLGLISGLVFLILFNILRCCLIRVCFRRRYKVNRRLNAFNQKLNKRNALDETHHLLISHHNLSDQEV